MVLIEYSNCEGLDEFWSTKNLWQICARSKLTNSLTTFEEPFNASLCTLDSSLLEDLVFDLDVDFEADVDLEVDELDLDVLVVLGSDML